MNSKSEVFWTWIERLSAVLGIAVELGLWPIIERSGLMPLPTPADVAGTIRVRTLFWGAVAVLATWAIWHLSYRGRARRVRGLYAAGILFLVSLSSAVAYENRLSYFSVNTPARGATEAWLGMIRQLSTLSALAYGTLFATLMLLVLVASSRRRARSVGHESAT